VSRLHIYFSIGFIIFVLSLTACGSSSAELNYEIIVTNSPCKIQSGASEAMNIEVAAGESFPAAAQINWEAPIGNIQNDDGTTVLYEAPDVDSDTTVKIVAKVTVGDSVTTEVVECKIIAAAGQEETPVSQANDNEEIPPTAEVVEETEPDKELDNGGAEGSETVESSTPSATPSRLDQILANGYFTGALRRNIPPFAFLDGNGQLVGFEVDILREFARRWFEDEAAFLQNYLAIESASERITVLTDGKADMSISVFSYTEERDEIIDFSQIYFEDGQQLLVRVDADPPIESVCDLDGRSVGVISGSTGIQNLINFAQEQCGFNIEGSLVQYPNHATAADDLRNGGVAAVTTDGGILVQYENDLMQVVGLVFSKEEYGIGLPPSDVELKTLVDFTLQAMKTDGTYDAIVCRWFGSDKIPYPINAPDTIEELLNSLDTEMQMLVTTNLPPLYDKNAECAPTIAPEIHAVQSGDTLTGISYLYYGTAAYWSAIFEENREAIEEAGGSSSVISIGLELKIPPLSELD
jgi:ABC-type amino acid transport substrate-binding protein